MFAGVAVLEALDRAQPRRFLRAAFWGAFAASFLFGDLWGDRANGLLLIAMVLIAGLGGFKRAPGQASDVDARSSAPSDQPLGAAWRIFAPALAVPLVTLAGALLLGKASVGGVPLIDPKQATPISLGLGVLSALTLAYAVLRPRPLEPLQAARGIIDAVGWAALLPQTLAALGAVFALAGVGHVVGDLLARVLPLDNRFAVVCAFTGGMALFTIIMGNAFAAFPVMAAAIGLPLIVRRFGGDPAVMGAVGMLSGFCGTLVTPMAANFNMVPAALLELKDRYGVIKAQAPSAAALLAANTLILYFFCFRR